MALRSMTGVGQASLPFEWEGRSWTLSVELRSLNSRFLECQIKSPVDAMTERRLQQLLSGALGRGRVDLRLEWQAQSEASGESEDVDEARLRALLGRLATIDRIAQSQWMSLAPVNAVDLWRELRGSQNSPQIKQAGPHESPQGKALVEKAVELALDGLLAMRGEEGETLSSQIRADAKGLADCRAKVQELRKSLQGELQQRLQDRLTALLAEERVADLGEARVAQELAVLLARGDVQEELIRIEAHLGQVSEILDEDAQAGQGKRLAFICQELVREWSTLGAKIPYPEASAIVVAAKTHIERIREQAQNVE